MWIWESGSVESTCLAQGSQHRSLLTASQCLWDCHHHHNLRPSVGTQQPNRQSPHTAAFPTEGTWRKWLDTEIPKRERKKWATYMKMLTEKEWLYYEKNRRGWRDFIWWSRLPCTRLTPWSLSPPWMMPECKAGSTHWAPPRMAPR